MKSRTPLSDLVSGAQHYLKLETKALRLKVYLAATDAAFGSLRLLATGTIVAMAVAFLGVALSLWLGTLIGRPAGFAVTGVLLAASAMAGWRLFSKKGSASRDRLLSHICGEPARYDDMRLTSVQLRSEADQLASTLEKQLQELGETAGNIERLFSGGDPEQNKSTGGQLVKSAAEALIRNALLPRAGAVGKVVVPVVAAALWRSAPVTRLVKKARTAFSRK